MNPSENARPGDLMLETQPAKPSGTWYFVTNQMNLMYMLAAGLIMPPLGFGKKYYEDTLALAPGWVPLFAETVPKWALDLAVRESETLRPVVAAINLSSVAGGGRGVSLGGGIRDIRLPDDLGGAHSEIFIPAPLPTAFIEAVYFSSSADKKSCEQDAKDYANVPLKYFKRDIRKRLLTGSNRAGRPPSAHFDARWNVPMDRFLAAGGMMAMLIHCGNMGKWAAGACSAAFEGPGAGFDVQQGDAGVRGLAEWMDADAPPATGSEPHALFWGIVEAVIAAGMDLDAHHTCQDAVLAHLKRSGDRSDEKTRAALSGLIADLSALSHLGDKNATELFETHKRELRRALILFFLRDRCADLLAFSHKDLTERDYMTAALLFAAREKWIGLPMKLRNVPGLDRAVSHRMAAMAHGRLKTGLELGSPPPGCRPLRALLEPGPGGWDRKQHGAALSLSRDMKWDCIETRIRLGRGQYRLTVDAGGVTLHLPGEVKAVETRIDPQRFFSAMTESRFLDPESEDRARGLL